MHASKTPAADLELDGRVLLLLLWCRFLASFHIAFLTGKKQDLNFEGLSFNSKVCAWGVLPLDSFDYRTRNFGDAIEKTETSLPVVTRTASVAVGFGAGHTIHSWFKFVNSPGHAEQCKSRLKLQCCRPYPSRSP
jgi:hypothetical protein